jgi:hypothetical protein
MTAGCAAHSPGPTAPACAAPPPPAAIGPARQIEGHDEQPQARRPAARRASAAGSPGGAAAAPVAAGPRAAGAAGRTGRPACASSSAARCTTPASMAGPVGRLDELRQQLQRPGPRRHAAGSLNTLCVTPSSWMRCATCASGGPGRWPDRHRSPPAGQGSGKPCQAGRSAPPASRSSSHTPGSAGSARRAAVRRRPPRGCTARRRAARLWLWLCGDCKGGVCIGSVRAAAGPA